MNRRTLLPAVAMLVLLAACSDDPQAADVPHHGATTGSMSTGSMSTGARPHDAVATTVAPQQVRAT
jgi:hypothetical protein